MAQTSQPKESIAERIGSYLEQTLSELDPAITLVDQDLSTGDIQRVGEHGRTPADLHRQRKLIVDRAPGADRGERVSCNRPLRRRQNGCRRRHHRGAATTMTLRYRLSPPAGARHFSADDTSRCVTRPAGCHRGHEARRQTSRQRPGRHPVRSPPRRHRHQSGESDEHASTAVHERDQRPSPQRGPFW